MRLNDRIEVACANMQVADTKAAILYARAHLRLKDLGPDALLLGRQSAVLMKAQDERGRVQALPLLGPL